MKTLKNRKGKRMASIKEAFLENIQMMRFVREIEREDPLDNETLNTMVAFQWQPVR